MGDTVESELTLDKRTTSRAGLLVLLAAALSGCLSLSSPDVDVSLPSRWRNAPVTPPSPTPELRSWWRNFSDPQLDTLIDQALEANLGIQEARTRLHAARALRRLARTEFLPELHGKTFDAVDPDASASFFVAGFDAGWELGLFGRREGVQRMARADLDRASANVRDARLSLVAEVARNWIELRAAQQRENLLTQIRDARLRQAELIAKRVSLALDSRQRDSRAQAAVADSQAALAAPRQAIVAAAQSLAALLGRAEPEPAWLVAGPLPQLGAWQLTEAPADLLRVRPDIARSQAEVLRASGELGVARADRYPNIGLGGSIHWSTNITANRQTQSDESISALGPVIDIPLFDWGMRRARQSAKADELRAAALAYRSTVLNAVAEVETALGAAEQQRQVEIHSLHAWQSLAEVAGYTRERQALGLASGIDRIDSAVERDQAALSLANARGARDLAYISLFKALGAAPITDAGHPPQKTPALGTP